MKETLKEILSVNKLELLKKPLTPREIISAVWKYLRYQYLLF